MIAVVAGVAACPLCRVCGVAWLQCYMCSAGAMLSALSPPAKQQQGPGTQSCAHTHTKCEDMGGQEARIGKFCVRYACSGGMLWVGVRCFFEVLWP